MPNFIINLLDETKDDVDYMVDFIIKHKHKFLRVSIDNFRLEENSEWYINPEKYGIKLLEGRGYGERYTLQRFNNSENDMLKYYKQNILDFKDRLMDSGLGDFWKRFPYNLLFALVDIFENVSDMRKWLNEIYYKNNKFKWTNIS